jgi:hypothetical protein
MDSILRYRFKAIMSVYVGFLAACSHGSDSVSPHALGDLLEERPEAAWLGTYEGRGAGVHSGMTVNLDMARLTILPDADSVKSEQCAGCVTVQLDTVFALVNVSTESPVSLALAYEAAGLSRTLSIDRYSGGNGQTGDVLLARLQVGAAGSVADVEYRFQRR